MVCSDWCGGYGREVDRIALVGGLQSRGLKDLRTPISRFIPAAAPAAACPVVGGGGGGDGSVPFGAVATGGRPTLSLSLADSNLANEKLSRAL